MKHLSPEADHQGGQGEEDRVVRGHEARRQARAQEGRGEVDAAERGAEEHEEVHKLLSGEAASTRHRGGLEAQVLGVHAHTELDHRGEGEKEEDGGEAHVPREVSVGALGALELDEAVAGAVLALPPPRAVVQATHCRQIQAHCIQLIVEFVEFVFVEEGQGQLCAWISSWFM